MKVSGQRRSGKRVLRKSQILFTVKKERNNSLQLKVSSLGKLRHLSFKEGSAVFVSLLKQLGPQLRKRGYAPEPTGPLDPFAILAGRERLPFKLVSRGMLHAMVDGGTNECVVCGPPGGGCACIECDKIVIHEP